MLCVNKKKTFFEVSRKVSLKTAPIYEASTEYDSVSMAPRKPRPPHLFPV